MAAVVRALAVVATGLVALAATACDAVPAHAPARAADPPVAPRFGSILAALTSDRAKADTDLANERTDITFGDGSPASKRCYILFNNVRYDVEQRLDHDAHVNTSSDAASMQSQLDAIWHELVNLQHYNQDFSNNGVAPFGGKWATAAIAAMTTKMTATAAAANIRIRTVNDDVAEGYTQYRLAWKRWKCGQSKLLRGRPVQVRRVKVRKLPKPSDP